MNKLGKNARRRKIKNEKYFSDMKEKVRKILDEEYPCRELNDQEFYRYFEFLKKRNLVTERDDLIKTLYQREWSYHTGFPGMEIFRIFMENYDPDLSSHRPIPNPCEEFHFPSAERFVVDNYLTEYYEKFIKLRFQCDGLFMDNWIFGNFGEHPESLTTLNKIYSGMDEKEKRTLYRTYTLKKFYKDYPQMMDEEMKLFFEKMETEEEIKKRDREMFKKSPCRQM